MEIKRGRNAGGVLISLNSEKLSEGFGIFILLEQSNLQQVLASGLQKQV